MGATGVESAIMPVERSVRYRCDMQGQLAAAAGAPASPVRVLEISETGVFIEDTPVTAGLELGAPASVTLPLPGGAAWSAAVHVVRHGRGRIDLRARGLDHCSVSCPGWGLEFLALDDDGLEQLRDFLELLDGR